MSWRDRIQPEPKKTWRDRIQPESPLAFQVTPTERKLEYGPTELETFLNSLGQGITLDNLDELKAAIETQSISGPEYEKAVTKERELMRLGEEQNPLSNIAGRTAGYAVPGIGATKLLKAPTFAKSLGIDALLGAGQGIGSAESISEIPQSAFIGAGASAVLPVVGKGVTKLPQKSIEGINKYLLNVDPEVTQTLMRQPSYLDEVLTTPEIGERFAGSLGEQKKKVSQLRKQSFETLGVKPFKGKQEVVTGLADLPQKFGVGPGTEAYPEAQAILREIDLAKQGLGQSKTQSDIKNILAMMDQRADFATPSGNQVNAIRKEIRTMIDQGLKEENPAYRAAMEELAAETVKLKRGVKASGVEQGKGGYVSTDRTTQKIETLLNNMNKDKQGQAKETIEAVSPGILEEIARTRLARKAEGGVQTGSRNAAVGGALGAAGGGILGFFGLEGVAGGLSGSGAGGVLGILAGGLIDKSGRNIGASLAKNYGRLSTKSKAAIDRVAPLLKGGNQTATHEFLMSIDPEYRDAIDELPQ